MTTSTSSSSEYSMQAGARTTEESLLLGNTGPASYADRPDRPDLTVHGEAKIVPMRVAQNFYVEPRDPDPRGMTVLGADDVAGGTIVDLWVDRSEPQVRYLEVSVAGQERTVLVPITVCRVNARRGTVMVNATMGAQFAAVPRTASDEQVTLLEEDRIQAYFAGGVVFATPRRARPLL